MKHRLDRAKLALIEECLLVALFVAGKHEGAAAFPSALLSSSFTVVLLSDLDFLVMLFFVLFPVWWWSLLSLV